MSDDRFSITTKVVIFVHSLSLDILDTHIHGGEKKIVKENEKGAKGDRERILAVSNTWVIQKSFHLQQYMYVRDY